MTEIERLHAELDLRNKQVGLMGDCLGHIKNGNVAPEPIKVAVSAALIGAMEIGDQIRAIRRAN